MDEHTGDFNIATLFELMQKNGKNDINLQTKNELEPVLIVPVNLFFFMTHQHI